MQVTTDYLLIGIMALVAFIAFGKLGEWLSAMQPGQGGARQQVPQQSSGQAPQQQRSAQPSPAHA